MDNKTRIVSQITGGEPDRIPVLGGWVNGGEFLARIAGITADEYFADPLRGVVAANRALGVDGIVRPMIITQRNAIRQGNIAEKDFAHVTPEDVRDEAEKLDLDPDAIRKRTDLGRVEEQSREYIEKLLDYLEDLVFIPGMHPGGGGEAGFGLYGRFGYAAYLAATALYPESVERFYACASIGSRLRHELFLKLREEYDLPPIFFHGPDICDQRGPLCSPEFLRNHYWKHARYSMEPLVEAGIRVVRHCDGNVMPLIDDFIGAGYSGLQGFQYECGVDLPELSKHRSLKGEGLVFMTGINITRTLFGTFDDIRAEIDLAMECTNGGKGLLFFTSSSIQPETPLENVRFAYEYAKTRK